MCLENTHNRGAGKVFPYEELVEICSWAHDAGLRTHLDGARLWNATAATGISEAMWSQHFDTVSVCFSKGLGAPVGDGPEAAVAWAGAQHPVLAGMVPAMTRMTVTPTGLQTHEPANVIPPFADVICDCRALPGISTSRDSCRASRRD